MQLVWVWILMLLQDEGTVSMWPPLMVVKPRCPSQVEHLQRVQLVFILQQISQLRISLLQPVSFFYFRLQIKLLYSPLHDSWLLIFLPSHVNAAIWKSVFHRIRDFMFGLNR